MPTLVSQSLTSALLSWKPDCFFHGCLDLIQYIDPLTPPYITIPAYPKQRHWVLQRAGVVRKHLCYHFEQHNFSFLLLWHLRLQGASITHQPLLPASLSPLSETLAGLVRPDTGTLANKRTARLRAAQECQRVHISHADA